MDCSRDRRQRDPGRHAASCARHAGSTQAYRARLAQRRGQTVKSLQDTYGPRTMCFGCGPANAKGLRIKSFPGEGDEVVCDWTPEEHHQAFPGVVNGGICGAILDCHSNWTAAYHLMRKAGTAEPPYTVTADFHVTLKRPTPLGPLHLRAHVVDSSDDRATVEATIEANGKTTATCRGTFVAVREGHPAFHRW